MSLRERIAAGWASAKTWYGGHSQRDQRVILGVIVLAALSLAYVGIAVPVRNFRQAVAEEIADGQEELERSARFLAAADSLRAERESLRKRLDQAKKRLLPASTGTLGAAKLQERANAIATEKGITVQSTQVMKEEEVDPYRKVSIRLTLSGELKPFAELISGLEHGEQLAIPFLEVSRRGAVAGAKGPRTLSATVEVTGFVQSEPPKAEEPPAEVPPDAAEGAPMPLGGGTPPVAGEPPAEGAPPATAGAEAVAPPTTAPAPAAAPAEPS